MGLAGAVNWLAEEFMQLELLGVLSNIYVTSFILFLFACCFFKLV